MDQRVHVNREAVADTPDLDVLIERIVVAILGQNTGVALTVGHLVLAGRVVGHVGVRDVLDVPNHAIEDLGHLNVSAVVCRDDLGLRPVLPLLVGHLMDVLRQLVDRQARPGVDGLTLHRATGRQHVSRPLPVVVGRAGVEPQVVKLVLTRLRQRRNRHVEAGSGRREHLRVALVLGRAALADRPSGGDSCVVHDYLILLRTLATVALTLTLPSFLPLHYAIWALVGVLRAGIPPPTIFGSRLLSLPMGARILLIFCLSVRRV